MLVPQSPRANRPSQVDVLRRDGPVEPQRVPLGRHLLRGGRGADQQHRGIARREPEQDEHQGDDPEHDAEAAHRAAGQQEHGLQSPRLRSATPAVDYLSPCLVACSALLLVLSALAGCQPAAGAAGRDRPASPPAPISRASTRCSRSIRSRARSSAMSCSRRSRATTRRCAAAVSRAVVELVGRPAALTLRLTPGVRWHDGAPTTARDVRWTLDAARDPVVGYPRAAELCGARARRDAPDDSTVVLGISPHRRPRFPTCSPTSPSCRRTCSIPFRHDRLRRAAWNDAPVGNGPFRFVAHEPNRRWVFAANPDFPAALGGPPKLGRLIIVVVDEPATKLAALTAGELDFAGIQPAHAQFVARDPQLAVVSYPLLLTYGIALNTRRPPFAALEARRRLDAAVDRGAIVQGYLYGFGTPSSAPVPPELPGYVPVARDTTSSRGGVALRFELLTVGSGEAPLEQMVQAQLRAVGHGRDDPPTGAVRLPRPGVWTGATTSRPRWSACRVTPAWPILARWGRSPA